MSDSTVYATSSAPPPRAFGLALAGLALVLLGPWVYMGLMDSPVIRSSGWPAFVLMGGGSILAAWAALRDRRLRAGLTAGAGLALTVLFIYIFFVALRLPPGDAPLVGAAAPDFSLVDGDHRPHHLDTAIAGGPILLVFYRGHW